MSAYINKFILKMKENHYITIVDFVSSELGFIPNDGDAFVVNPNSTGRFNAKTGLIAIYNSNSSSYDFIYPKNGWKVFNNTSKKEYTFVNNQWLLNNSSVDELNNNLLVETVISNWQPNTNYKKDTPLLDMNNKLFRVLCDYTSDIENIQNDILSDKLELINETTQIQCDWNQVDSTELSYIKNKPIIPDKISQIINDSNFETSIESELKINNAINVLKDGVSADGNTLAKLRILISEMQAVLNSDDVNLDTLQKVVTYIKDNKSILDSVTTNKVNVSDIIDSLASTVTNKPLSANQGKVLKDLLDTLTTTVSGKQANITAGTTSQYYRGDKTWQTLDKNVVGLNNIDNVSDLSKPISTATQTALNGKENTLTKGSITNGSSKVSVTGGTGAIIGTGVLVDVVESNINIGNLAGTTTSSKISDFAFSVRSTVLTGLDTTINSVISVTDTILGAIGKLQKQISDNLITLTNHTSNTSNPHSTTKAQVGLDNVDNTSDSAKPVSTATQAALNLKLDSNSYTASDVLTKVKTVDGSASGLDADLLDGQEGSYYLNYNNLSNKPTLPTSLSQLTDDSTHRTATDTEKTTWTNKQDALGFTAVPNTRTVNGKALSSNISLDKSDVGLSNVSNTDTTTTSNINDSLDKRFVSDIQRTSITHTNRATLDVITNSGDGTKYLSNDGTYKAVTGGGTADAYTKLETDTLLLSKASDSVVSSHIENMTMHVTQEDKDKWNLNSGSVYYGVNTSANDSYILTIPGITSYYDGLMVTFISTVANSYDCSININGLGVKSIYKKTTFDSDLSTGDILANQVVVIVYYNNAFYITSNLSNTTTANNTQYLTNKTYNGGTFNTPVITDKINDLSGNELIKFTSISNAKNEITISNAATGNSPSFTASGNDTNIDMNFVSKGTGKIKANGIAVSLEGHTHPNSGGVNLGQAIAISVALG